MLEHLLPERHALQVLPARGLRREIHGIGLVAAILLSSAGEAVRLAVVDLVGLLVRRGLPEPARAIDRLLAAIEAGVVPNAAVAVVDVRTRVATPCAAASAASVGGAGPA